MLDRVESVAQLVEHRPFKALVLGSSPSALTTSPHFYDVGLSGAGMLVRKSRSKRWR
jgi:hypothetical protein